MIATVLHLQEGAGVALDAVDRMRGVTRHRHDVADRDAPIIGPRTCVEFFSITQNAVDLGHVCESIRLGLRGAAGDDEARLGMVAAQASDLLARLAHCLGGHRAAVDDDQIVLARGDGPHRLTLGGIEPATEVDDLGSAHAATGTSISPEKT